MAKNALKLKGKRGVTLVECVVAIAIFAIMSLLAYRGFTTGFNNIKKGDDNATAANNSTVVFAKAKAHSNIKTALENGSSPAKTTYTGNDLKNLVGQNMPGTLTVKKDKISFTDPSNGNMVKTVEGLVLTYEYNGYTYTDFVAYK